MLLKTHLYYFIFNQIHYFLREDRKITERRGKISNQYHGFQGQERIQMIAQKIKERAMNMLYRQ